MNNALASPTVLTSWKEIALYMGKGVRTVQRWEQDFGLPVRRPLGSNKKAILARPIDLDAWVALRCSSRSDLGTIANLPAEPLQGNGHSRPNPSLSTLSALNAQIATSRMLQDRNRLLLSEVRTAVADLQRSLVSMSAI